MRFGWVVAAAAMVAAAPASAATIVQTDSQELQRGFDAFNGSLGVLNSATLAISVFSPRDISITIPAGSSASRNIGYSISGTYAFRVLQPGIGDLFEGSLALTGSDSKLVAFNDQGYGGLQTVARGSQTFELDPRLFTRDAPFGSVSNLRLVLGRDEGFTRSQDTTLFGVPVSSQVAGIGGCNRGGQDFCVQAGYTLTYDYTPTAVGSVPEPTTWAMMVIGFGAMGATIRRRKRATASALRKC